MAYNVEIKDRASRSRDTDVWIVQVWAMDMLPETLIVILNDEEDLITTPRLNQFIPFSPSDNAIHEAIEVAIAMRVADEE